MIAVIRSGGRCIDPRAELVASAVHFHPQKLFVRCLIDLRLVRACTRRVCVRRDSAFPLVSGLDEEIPASNFVGFFTFLMLIFEPLPVL